MDITGPYDNFLDKMKAIQEQSPDIFEKIINLGKTKKLFEMYDKLKKYIN